MQRKGHVLVVAYPLQGHAGPLLKLSCRIAEHGIQVTFAIAEQEREIMLTAMPDFEEANQLIKLVSVPDGSKSGDDRKMGRNLAESFHAVMPSYLDGLLSKDCTGITGVIFDPALSCFVGIPKKMGLKTAVSWTSNPGCLALGLKIQKLLGDKVIDENGAPLQQIKIHLLENMPEMDPCEFTWYFPDNINMEKEMFQFLKGMTPCMQAADMIICNWFDELAPSAQILMPNLLTVGPLITRNGQSAGIFYSEDHNCLSWLDKQTPGSVIYVAFGSSSKFGQEQLDELAMALELINRPFLWVAWSGLTNGSSHTYPDGFRERIGDRGMLVEWAPQEMVLSHTSAGCFISHCGWSSTMESISTGVPFLCWPYFGDQMYARTCLCDAWKVALRLTPEANGIVSRCEIRKRVNELLSDATIKANALKLKQMAMKSIQRGGSSSNNLEFIVEQMSHKYSSVS